METIDTTASTLIEQQMANQGIALVTLPVLQQRDNHWMEKLWQLDWTLIQDVPAFTQRTQPTLEEFAQRFQRADHFAPGWVVAIAQQTGEYVGLSQVYRSKASEQWLETGLTGVIRSHRRRRIATAMKHVILAVARHHGYTQIRTRNADGNPMYVINRQLGFQPLPAWRTYEKIAGSRRQVAGGR